MEVLLGCSAGVGLDEILKSNNHAVLRQLSSVRNYVVMSLVVAVGLYYLSNKPAGLLINRYKEQKKQIGIADLNSSLYEYAAKKPIKKYILTNYNVLRFLPGFEKLFRGAPLNLMSNEEFKSFKTLVTDRDVGYILFPNPNHIKATQIGSDIINRVNTGKYQLIFEKDDWWFVKIIEY
jgi:hypothetical protein